jgi:hypothetical protein
MMLCCKPEIRVSGDCQALSNSQTPRLTIREAFVSLHQARSHQSAGFCLSDVNVLRNSKAADLVAVFHDDTEELRFAPVSEVVHAGHCHLHRADSDRCASVSEILWCRTTPLLVWKSPLSGSVSLHPHLDMNELMH